jgi:hypothetical protein
MRAYANVASSGTDAIGQSICKCREPPSVICELFAAPLASASTSQFQFVPKPNSGDMFGVATKLTAEQWLPHDFIYSVSGHLTKPVGSAHIFEFPPIPNMPNPKRE